MTVEVVYRGRAGNNLFQYACARLFAQENVLELRTPPPPFPWIPVSVPTQGKSISAHEPIRLGDADRVLDRPWAPGRYLLDGFFQDADWYWKRRDAVLATYPMAEPVRLPEDHVVVCVRLGDYWSHRIVIEPSWYLGILSSLRPSKVTVVTDDATDSYHSVFRHFKARIVSGTLGDDFQLIRSASTVVLSNSTFAWWGAFLGGASKVYTFSRWIGNPDARLARFPGAVAVDGRFAHEC